MEDQLRLVQYLVQYNLTNKAQQLSFLFLTVQPRTRRRKSLVDVKTPIRGNTLLVFSMTRSTLCHELLCSEMRRGDCGEALGERHVVAFSRHAPCPPTPGRAPFSPAFSPGQFAWRVALSRYPVPRRGECGFAFACVDFVFVYLTRTKTEPKTHQRIVPVEACDSCILPSWARHRFWRSIGKPRTAKLRSLD